MHGASATEPHAATEFGAGKFQFVAEIPEERQIAVPVEFTGFAVDGEFDHNGSVIITFFDSEPESDESCLKVTYLFLCGRGSVARPPRTDVGQPKPATGR